MYKNDTYTGNVILKSTGKVVAPAHDPEDQDYKDYVAWANEGNIPEDFSSYEESGDALKDEQLRVWELIKKERERRQYEAVLVEGNWFHSDIDSRIKYEKFLKMGDMLPATPWKVKSPDGGLFNPIFVQMTPALLVKIANAIVLAEIAIFPVAETHRVGMLAASVPGEYDYMAGWPIGFSDTYPGQ